MKSKKRTSQSDKPLPKNNKTKVTASDKSKEHQSQDSTIEKLITYNSEGDDLSRYEALFI
ncbi:MAG: hypothetical protein QGD92_14615 [Gammaproteobacteria bacterium]|nr:hypothetical protein [Gammaproteobacteria bacterium]